MKHDAQTRPNASRKPHHGKEPRQLRRLAAKTESNSMKMRLEKYTNRGNVGFKSSMERVAFLRAFSNAIFNPLSFFRKEGNKSW